MPITPDDLIQRFPGLEPSYAQKAAVDSGWTPPPGYVLPGGPTAQDGPAGASLAAQRELGAPPNLVTQGAQAVGRKLGMNPDSALPPETSAAAQNATAAGLNVPVEANQNQFAALRPYTVPAHWTDTTESIKGGMEDPARAQAIREESLASKANIEQGIAGAGEAGVGEASAREDYAKKRADMQAQDIEYEKARQEALAPVIARKNAYLEQQTKEFQATAAEDPEAAWGGAVHHVLGGIAMALGAAGSALTHTPNYAMEIVNKGLDDNLRAQRAAYEKKKGNLAIAQDDYSNAVKMLGSPDAAHDFIRAKQYAGLEGSLNSALATATTEKAKANISTMLGEAQEKRTQAEIDLENKLGGEKTRNRKYTEAQTVDPYAQTAGVGGAAGGGGYGEKYALMQSALNRAESELGKNKDMPGVGPYQGNIPPILQHAAGVFGYDVHQAERNRLALKNLAAAHLRARGGRVNDESIEAEKRRLFGHQNQAEVEAGMSTIKEEQGAIANEVDTERYMKKHKGIAPPAPQPQQQEPEQEPEK